MGYLGLYSKQGTTWKASQKCLCKGQFNATIRDASSSLRLGHRIVRPQNLKTLNPIQIQDLNTCLNLLLEACKKLIRLIKSSSWPGLGLGPLAEFVSMQNYWVQFLASLRSRQTCWIWFLDPYINLKVANTCIFPILNMNKDEHAIQRISTNKNPSWTHHARIRYYM